MSAAATRCSVAGCNDPIFTGTLCFEHNRREKLNSSSSSSNARGAKPIVATKNKAAITDLIGGVRKQPGFSRMVGYSIECLRKMAVDEVSVEEMLEAGTIEALEEAMAMHPDNEKLHAEYMDLLRVFSLNSRAAKTAGEKMKHHFSKFTNSLRNHQNVETHIATANAIAALAQDGANMDAMADQGVLDALADACKRFPNNSELLAAAAKVFSKFANHKKEYADFITNSGATQVIINRMQADPSHLDLARNGAELLSILAGSSQANLDSLKRMGAVDALVAVLEAHPYNRELEKFATTALSLLTGENDVFQALSVCRGDMALDLATAKALSKIASLLLVADNVDAMFRHKGVDWLIALLASAAAGSSVDPLGNRILVSGLRALMRSALDENKIYDIMKHGGVQLLIGILNTHLDKDVLAAALGALAKLIGSRQENAIYVVNHGGINASLRAYASFPNELEIVRPMVDLLAACSVFDSVSPSLLAAGSIEALMDMFRRHINSAGMVRDIIAALGRMAVSEENVRRMGAAGYNGLLCEAMKLHGEDRDVVRSALLALETCALLPENIPALRKLGAVELIHAAMARFPNDEEIQAIGRRALALLLQEQLERERAAREAAERERLAQLERERLERERLEREAAEMAAALERLRMQDEAEERERERLRRQKELEDDIKLKEYQKREEEERQRRKLEALNLPARPIEIVKPVYRSARALFEAEDEEPKVFEMDPDVKQFLLSGQMLTKHSKTALPASKHLYLSQDLARLIWNKPMTEILAKNTMNVTSIYAVTRGHCTPQLQRVRFGIPLAGPEENCFSISGAGGADNKERSVDLECKSFAERERWVECLEQLIRWVRTKKLYGNATVKMTSSEKVAKSVAKEQRAGLQ